jgi:methylated-DNA-[protein]-cysteine S-methyltransferase
MNLSVKDHNQRVLNLQITSNGLMAVELGDDRLEVEDMADELGREVVQQFEEYFAKNRTRFTLPIDPCALEHLSPFERSVLDVLRTIPFGSTLSYSDIAKAIGREGAVRAVGRACGRNPLPLVIPCHRVIAKNGSLGGFNLGVDMKKSLLELEGIMIAGEVVVQE